MPHPAPAILKTNHPPIPLYIDSSMLSTFRACRRKYYWSYVQNFQPMGESIHLIAGKAFASGCEAARRAQLRSGKLPLSSSELLEAAIGPFTAEWKDFEASPDDAKNYHNVFAAFEDYICHRYHPATDEVQPINIGGVPGLEYSFAIPLPVKHPSGDNFIFCGKLDVLGIWNEMLTVILDEKTTSMMGVSWTRQWDLRGQFLGYVWAARELGFNVSTVIVRGIAIQKTQHQFAQLPVQVPTFLVDRWYHELLGSLADLVSAWESDRWPFNFADACSSYGGCSFLDLCKSVNPEHWLNNYEERTWSPIKQGEF